MYHVTDIGTPDIVPDIDPLADIRLYVPVVYDICDMMTRTRPDIGCVPDIGTRYHDGVTCSATCPDIGSKENPDIGTHASAPISCPSQWVTRLGYRVKT